MLNYRTCVRNKVTIRMCFLMTRNQISRNPLDQSVVVIFWSIESLTFKCFWGVYSGSRPVEKIDDGNFRYTTTCFGCKVGSLRLVVRDLIHYEDAVRMTNNGLVQQQSYKFLPEDIYLEKLWNLKIPDGKKNDTLSLRLYRVRSLTQTPPSAFFPRECSSEMRNKFHKLIYIKCSGLRSNTEFVRNCCKININVKDLSCQSCGSDRHSIAMVKNYTNTVFGENRNHAIGTNHDLTHHQVYHASLPQPFEEGRPSILSLATDRRSIWVESYS